MTSRSWWSSYIARVFSAYIMPSLMTSRSWWSSYIERGFSAYIMLFISVYSKKRSVQAIYGNPSHNYGVSLVIWDHTVLPATRHKWTHTALTTARQADTRFTYPGGMEGWVDLGDWLHTEMVYPPTDGKGYIPSGNLPVVSTCKKYEFWFWMKRNCLFRDTILIYRFINLSSEGNSISQLWGVTCHVGSHSVTCHLTQVNSPRLNPSQTGWPLVDLPTF